LRIFLNGKLISIKVQNHNLEHGKTKITTLCTENQNPKKTIPFGHPFKTLKINLHFNTYIIRLIPKKYIANLSIKGPIGHSQPRTITQSV